MENELPADSPTEYLQESDDDPDWHPEENCSVNQPTNVSISNAAAAMSLEQCLPESFVVDGEQREDSGQSPVKSKRKQKRLLFGRIARRRGN